MISFRFLASSKSFLGFVVDLATNETMPDILTMHCFGGELSVLELPTFRKFYIESNKTGVNRFQLPKDDISKIIRFLSSFSDTPILIIPDDGHLTFSDIMI